MREETKNLILERMRRAVAEKVPQQNAVRSVVLYLSDRGIHLSHVTVAKYYEMAVNQNKARQMWREARDMQCSWDAVTA